MAPGRMDQVSAKEPQTNVPSVQPHPLDAVAVWVTRRVGSMGFFLAIFTWTVLWLIWNAFAPKSLRFDPFPGFVLWLFISNMIQLFLMPLLLIGQNLLGRTSEERAKRDFDVNRRAEKEINQIKAQLDAVLARLDDLASAQPARAASARVEPPL